MELAEFSIQRCDEELARRGCTYEVSKDGRFRCSSHCPSDTLELLAQRELIPRWASAPDGDLMLGLAADRHAAHPDYQPEWHDLST